MKTLPIAALALSFLAAPLRAEQPALPAVTDAAQASAAVKAAVAKAPENKSIVDSGPGELAPLLMFMPYGAEFEGIDGLKLESLEDAKELVQLRFSYWEKVAAVLSREVDRLGGGQKDLKVDSISVEPMSEQLRRMKESVALQGSARLARMIASDAAADQKAVMAIQSLDDKAGIRKAGADAMVRKGKLFAALAGAGDKKDSGAGR